jgi:ABC-type molybdate transport system substrate-binding protein
VDRFLRAVQPAVWGYTLSNVFVMSRDAFLSTGKLLSHAAATEAQLLIKLSDVQLDATVLYVSHKWSSLSDPDASGDTYTQVSHCSTNCTYCSTVLTVLHC